ncbi:hypothetical protein L21SP3_00603 [Sedimentisphaera cyanobacteriorum]|uniref:Uncharacterized protein n=1 Tax=Sedimentisphaera cyanobacteriorum TaxID=1940790 RepID=A0A1Q2HNM4_9BACT|nr:Ada metal-binding domain-containing protein [Sedimentisphaera cyanobacteriorum]AQQ08813.1 hypothetical protein L21SP3_00603 [Sedimentisphaera cyanobacteriorum]
MKFHCVLLLVLISFSAGKPAYNADYKGSNGDLSVKMNITGWPAVVGKNLKVIVKAVSMPPAVDDKEDLRFYSSRLKRFLDKSFNDAEKISLHSIERAEDEFAVKADIRLEGRSLSRILLREGFAVKKVLKKESDKQPEKEAEIEQNRPSNAQKIANNCELTPKKEKESDSTSIKDQNFQETAKAGKKKLCASKNSRTFHKTSCFFVERILEENIVYFDSFQDAVKSGRKPCQSCKPAPRKGNKEESQENK